MERNEGEQRPTTGCRLKSATGPEEAGKERGKKGRKEKSPGPHCPLAFLLRAIDRLRLQPG